MCQILDTKVVEYLINILDIVSDLIFAWLIFDKCVGWSISLIILSAIGIFGFILKFIAQCFRKEKRIERTNEKRLYWSEDCTTPYFFGVIIELLFEGLFIGIIEAIIIGNLEKDDLFEDYVEGILIMIIKLIYNAYVVFRYCLMSKEDHFKPWFIMLAVTNMIIVYGLTICTTFDIFASISFAHCV